MTFSIFLGLAHLALDLALIWALFGRAGKRGAAATLNDGRVKFAPDWIGLWAYPLTIVYLVLLAMRGLLQSHERPWDFIAPAVLGLFALLLLFFFPGEVIISSDGLEEVYWFRKNKRIRWKDIAEIETDKKNTRFSIVSVTGVDGTSIVHSWLLADQPRLLIEIQRHCGEDLPPDFHSAPVEGS